MKQAKRESDKYEESASTYNALHQEEQLQKIKLVISHLDIKPTEKLLDVGCGTGFSLTHWPTRHVTGAEPSHAMIHQAPLDLQKNIIQLRAEEMSIFEDHEFDIVVSITALHNFTGKEDGLLEMKRVGKEKFAFTVLKKSEHAEEIDALIKQHFNVREVIDETHDKIYLCW